MTALPCIQVPMFGYGGVSQVVTTNTKKSRNGETVHMGEVNSLLLSFVSVCDCCVM